MSNRIDMHLDERFYAISRLSKIHLNSDEKSKIQAFLEGIQDSLEDQKSVFQYCLKFKLAPWIFLQLLQHNFLHLFSQEVIALFEEEHGKISTQNSNRNEEAVRFLQKFEDKGIEAIILKGNYFSHTIYKDVGYKRMNDFDMLIQAKRWGDIQDIFNELDYIPLGFGWTGEKQEPAKFSHVGTPFISNNFHCIIGTQWGLKSPTTRYSVRTEELWKDKSEFQFYEVPTYGLSPEHNLLHLILHMGIYKCGIRDCMDVYNVWMSHEFDEDKLVELFTRAKAIEKAYFTLTLSNICSGVIPETLLEKLRTKSKNSFVVRRLAGRLKMIQKGHDLHSSYNDYFQDIEKEVIYFNLYFEFHVKLKFYGKILQKTLFPDLTHSLKFLDKNYESPSFFTKLKGRLKAPYYIFSLIAEEIGWRFTMLLFFKLFFDLLFSIKNYFVKTESYFDYLKNRGINPRDVQKCVQNVQ